MNNLIKPLETGKLKLKNRLVMPPMATAKAEKDGSVSEAVLEYYDEKTKGGYISLVIIEHSNISMQGKASENQLSVAEDSLIDGLKKLSNLIHENGCKTVMQINHAGSLARTEITGKAVVAPSVVVNPREGDVIPEELTVEEIKGIVEEFKNAALRVKAAGFDGLEIHSAHGYLLNQFFSPLTNKRSDQYGGDVHNRIRIHLEVIKAVREAVGEDFPILLRLGACDYKEGGSRIEDSLIAAVEFEKAGIDILDVTGGLFGFIKPGDKSQGYFSELTEAIKKVISIPVILTGGIKEPEAAESLLAEGKADLIGVARTILKDSTWVRKAIENLS